MSRVVLISAYYNRANYVERTVKGVVAQTYNDYQAYFIDDGSTDNTADLLEAHATSGMRVIRQPNMGFTRSVKTAIDQTDSDYIAIQGSGDVSHPDRLREQATFLDENPTIVAVGCFRNRISELDDNRVTQRPSIQADLIKQLHSTNPFSQGEVMIRRSAYDKAGGYRDFFTYRQDLDLWLRLAEIGDFGIVPKVLYDVYYLRDSVSHNVRKAALAALFRDFAVFCSRERLAGRPDPLALYGAAATLLRPRSSIIASDLAFSARRRAVKGDISDAQYMIDIAAGEYLNLDVRLTQLMLRAPIIWAALGKVRSFTKRQR